METGKVLIYLKNKNRGLASINGTAETAVLQDIEFEIKTGDEIIFDVIKNEKGLIAQNVIIQDLE